MIWEPDCGDLLPFSHKSLTEVSHWCWVTRPGWQFIPEVSDGGSRGQTFVRASQLQTHQTVKTIYSWTWLCAQGHCFCEMVFLTKRKLTAHKHTRKRASIYIWHWRKHRRRKSHLPVYLHALTAAEEWEAAEKKRDRVGGLVIVLFTPRKTQHGEWEDEKVERRHLLQTSASLFLSDTQSVC